MITFTLCRMEGITILLVSTLIRMDSMKQGVNMTRKGIIFRLSTIKTKKICMEQRTNSLMMKMKDPTTTTVMLLSDKLFEKNM